MHGGELVRLLRRDLHALTGAYTLDAVEVRERDRFERHLRRCRPCDDEILGLAETATALAFAVAAPPPAELRSQVLAVTSATRQVPAPTSPRWRPAAAWVPRLAAGVAAASVAVAAVLGVIVVSTQHKVDAARAQNQAIAAVLGDPDARIASQATARGGTATVVVSRAEHQMVVTTNGLPPLPANEVYELWLMGPPRVRPAGLLPRPSAGRTAPLLASGLQAGDQIGMTVEPAGGTSIPTTTPILVMSLPT
jgi:anti-sigma factor RsiW